jgi:hypothetical protein
LLVASSGDREQVRFVERRLGLSERAKRLRQHDLQRWAAA